jgi:hypothetical protein
VDLEVQRRLAQGGEWQCSQCTMPVLDPVDDDFAAKAAFIGGLARAESAVSCVACGCHTVRLCVHGDLRFSLGALDALLTGCDWIDFLRR